LRQLKTKIEDGSLNETPFQDIEFCIYKIIQDVILGFKRNDQYNNLDQNDELSSLIIILSDFKKFFAVENPSTIFLYLHEEFRNLVTTLRNYSPLHRAAKNNTFAPLIIWRAPSYATLYPAQFHFKENVECKKYDINFGDICQLKHSTGGDKLAQILEIEDGIVTLKPNRSADVDDKCHDISSTGLLYCGIDLPRVILDDCSSKYIKENRYGSCVISFRIDSQAFAFFQLGTKEYMYEHSQLMLADENVRREKWVVILDEKKTSFDILPVNRPEFNWTVKYSEEHYWTHPEVVFPFELKVKPNKIIFQDHECIKKNRGRCIECKMMSRPSSVKVERFHHDSGTVKMEPVEVTSGDEFLAKYRVFHDKASLALGIYSLSLDIGKRKSLVICQEKHSIFQDDQFQRMKHIWGHKDFLEFYYKFSLK